MIATLEISELQNFSILCGLTFHPVSSIGFMISTPIYYDLSKYVMVSLEALSIIKTTDLIQPISEHRENFGNHALLGIVRITDMLTLKNRIPEKFQLFCIEFGNIKY